MNKLSAQFIDRFAMTFLSPKFNASEVFKAQNLYLLDQPPLPPKRLIKTPKLFLKKTKRKGNLEIYDYAFPSRVQTSLLKNNTVYGKYFKLNNKDPKSTIILLHGMHDKNHRYQNKHALNLAKNGHNCLTVSLPYHVERAVRRSSSGSELLCTNLKSIFEAMQQAVKDVLALVNWLTANGEKRIGLLGVNLGGLIAGYVASVTRKLNYVILITPTVTPLQITGYNILGKDMDERIEKTGLSKEQLLELMRPWELIEHKPQAYPNRTLLIEAIHDTIVPSGLVEKIWDKWGKPQIKRYNHGHLSMLASRQVFKDINKFLDEAFAHQTSTGVLR